LPYRVGLYLEVITGTIEGVVMVVSAGDGHEDGIPVVIVGDLTVNVNEGAGS